MSGAACGSSGRSGVTEIPDTSALETNATGSSTATVSIPQFAWTKSLLVTYEHVSCVDGSEVSLVLGPSKVSVTATDSLSRTLTYQWFVNDVAIANNDKASLELSSVAVPGAYQISAGSSYQVQVVVSTSSRVTSAASGEHGRALDHRGELCHAVNVRPRIQLGVRGEMNHATTRA